MATLKCPAQSQSDQPSDQHQRKETNDVRVNVSGPFNHAILGRENATIAAK